MYKRDILETEILWNVWKSSNLCIQMQSYIETWFFRSMRLPETGIAACYSKKLIDITNVSEQLARIVLRHSFAYLSNGIIRS